MLLEERKIELRDNYFRVLENIEAARTRRGGGDPVAMLAATKTVPEEEILYLVRECGMKLCGENRQKEFTAKYDAVVACGARMDFIGHLQTNKIRFVAGRAGLIHSLDSLKLAGELNARCALLGCRQDVLIEINIGEEEAKSGVSPDQFDEFYARLCDFSHLSVRGIMTMGPKCEKNEEFRPYFRNCYQIYLDFLQKKSHNIGDAVLSMGMSDSYVCAVEEGSNMVRVGSAIFGSRSYPAKPAIQA